MKHIQLFEEHTPEEQWKPPLSDAYDVRISVSAETPNRQEEGKIVTSSFIAYGRGRTRKDAATFALASLHLGLESLTGHEHEMKDGRYHVTDLADANSILDKALENYEESREVIINDLGKGIIEAYHLRKQLGYRGRVRASSQKITGNHIDDNGGYYTQEEIKIEPDPWAKKPSMADLRKAIASGDHEEVKRINKLRYKL